MTEAEGGQAQYEMIEPLRGTDKFVVRMRQHLRTPEKADEFVLQLSAFCEHARDEGKTVVFEDFDISQNLLQPDHIEGILAALTETNAHVERFRAFALPHLDDMACTALAGWLSSVTLDNAPCEMHLSDCAITAVGFTVLIQALIENDAFPPNDPKHPGRRFPMYLRLEHNYIDGSAIQEKVDEGVISVFKKQASSHFSDKVKVRLLVHEDGKFKQKDGDPPNPEDAPPPKRVHETRFTKGSGKNGHSKGGPIAPLRESGRSWDRDRSWGGSDRSRGSDRSFWSSGGDRSWDRDRDRDSDRRWSHDRYNEHDDRDRRDWRSKGDYSSRQALPAASSSTRETLRFNSPRIRGGSSSHGHSRSSRESGSRRGVELKPAPRSESYTVTGKSSGSSRPRASESAADAPASKRSRIDGGREARDRDRKADDKGTSGSDRRPPREPRASAGGKLPPDWEEHFSDEYKINYYWNCKTGASSWERPTQ
mmetsp:Transcript_75987/g.180768  ORF Transcript_75987/g.180768 Transcript_75987/m.180768 type:complete len:480 (-) Transcript_75987:156-1595(-)